MKVRLTVKDTRGLYPLSRDMSLTCEDYSWHVYGGPEEATISVSGPSKNMADLLFTLRCGIEILDDDGVPLWWGFVNRVEIPIGKVRIVADLEEMANKVAIAYTLVNFGGTNTGVRRTSSWYSDQSSIERYGIKELLDTGTDLNVVAADAITRRKLEEMKNPVGYVVRESGGGNVARLSCKGWWQTTSWQYADVDSKLALSFQSIGTANYGLDGTRTKLAQTFSPSSSLNVMELGVYVRKVGNPGALTVSVCQNPDDLTPGDEVFSVTIPAENVSTSSAWVKGILNQSTPLAGGGKFFLVISGAGVDASNQYVFTLDENLRYGGGVAVEEVSSLWQSIQVDIPFQIFINELVETSQQIQNLITSSAQFLKRVFVENKSGIATESYRSGDTTAFEELESLLEIGTNNYRRLLIRVGIDRSVWIWEQPVAGNEEIQMWSDGKLHYRGGGLLEQHRNPVGKWINTENVISRANHLGVLTGLQTFFCERAQWNAAGEITVYPANWKNPYSVRVQNG